MPTSHTLVTIANRAIDIIEENPISTLDDTGAVARWIKRNYAHTVELSLREQPWNFACEYHSLNAEPSAPAYRWKNRYKPPNGWVRVLPLTHNGERGGRPVASEVKGNFIYANAGGSLRAEIVMNIQDPGQWDPLFAEMIAARLAVGMAHRFTGKNSYVETARALAQQAYETAEAINAFEGSAEPLEQHDIIRARYDDTDFFYGRL